MLLAEDGQRVIDFGIARATSGTAAIRSIIGTPGFMSPEQIRGEPVTPKSDMFGYGAVLAGRWRRPASGGRVMVLGCPECCPRLGFVPASWPGSRAPFMCRTRR
ncbi:protein kinase domain-containing protein [Marinactinospora rubrisoli]|uniref:non-specific serine/threonine protein kinase n=1 Tax=Marinactinospora rubrisoli TaxID=2715399 RepID=A0ABW2KPH7_9ACTN